MVPPFIIYADLEPLMGKTVGCKKNLEKLFTTKLSEHIPSGFSMSIISSLKRRENKHDVYRCKDCMKKFWKILRKKMKLLTKNILNYMKNEEKFEDKYIKD